MKILHIFLNMGAAPNFPMRKAMKNIFSFYQEIDWLDLEKKHGIDYLNKEIKNQVSVNKFDICFMQIQREGVIFPETIEFMKNCGVFVVNWTGDVSKNTKWLEDLGKYCNLTLFTNRTDSQRLTNLGIKSDYLQVSFDNENFIPTGTTGNYGEIVFLGNNYEGFIDYPLIEDRKNMVLKLKEHFGEKFQVYGGGWDKYLITRRLNEVQEAECYRSAKIGINYSHFNYQNYSSDRIFRIMGSGCFCLTHNFNGLTDEFHPGVNLDKFNDHDELITKVNNWICDNQSVNDLRKTIAEIGCQYVHTDCNWTERFKELIKLYYKYK